MKSFSFFAVSVLSIAAPLIKKKIPVATPSSARVNPAPQKTAGPRLGGTAAISGTPVDHVRGVNVTLVSAVICLRMMTVVLYVHIINMKNNWE